ncbi:MAG: type II toxin-antitoxin system VapC family toxin [Xanthomonadaceae bacterium]|nr:type II toxin-antitoxin system VapC family toxin [Xanthomonadaceae bacterium]
MVVVPDASVVLKWFISEKDSDKALRVLEQLINTPDQIAIPELVFYEVLNTLNRFFPNEMGNPKSDRYQLLEKVFYFFHHRFVMTVDQINRVHHYQSLGLSGYDATYVVLAEKLKGIWLTFDSKAASVLKNSKFVELL